MDHEGLAESNHTLLGTRNGALEHEEVVLHDTVVRETAHRSDGLLGRIGIGRRVGIAVALADSVDLFVELRTVMVSVYVRHDWLIISSNKVKAGIRTLTGTSDREHDLRWMPCTNTSNLTETFVCLARKLLRTPTVSDTLEAMTLCHRNDIDHLVLLEDRADWHGLLE